MYLNARNRVKQEGERRSVFLRYLGEVAGAVGVIRDFNDDRCKQLYERLLGVAQKKTAEADIKFDDRGRKVTDEELDLGENVLIVSQEDSQGAS
jgi:DNA topoisomerase-6 subunit B